MVERQAYIRLKALSNGQAGVERHKQNSPTQPRIFLTGQERADQEAITRQKAAKVTQSLFDNSRSRRYFWPEFWFDQLINR